MQNEEKPLIFTSVIFLSVSIADGSYLICSGFRNGSSFYRSGIIGLSLFKKGMIIYNRCLLFIFSNPFIMKVHCMTPGSYITPLCMLNTCRHLIYRWSCRTVIFLKSRSSLSMRELSQFAMSTGNSIISVLTVLF